MLSKIKSFTMFNRNLNLFVLVAFALYGLLSLAILYRYHQQTSELIEQQEILAESNRVLNKKYEILLRDLKQQQQSSGASPEASSD